MSGEADGVVRVDLAVLGTNVVIDGNGAVAALSFETTGEGTGSVGISQAEARDAENLSLEMRFDRRGPAPRGGDAPEVFALRTNTPNPFSSSTVVHYDVPRTSPVSIKIYNIRGQAVCTLVSEVHAAGRYSRTWNARDGNGRRVSPGIYFCEFRSFDFVSTQKMLMTR